MLPTQSRAAVPAPAAATIRSSGVTSRDLSLWYLWSIPVAAAIAGVKGLKIGPLEYTGYLWLSYLLVGLLLLQVQFAMDPKTKIRFPIIPWLPWLTLVWMSVLWISDFSFRNIQDGLQISLPFVVGMLASVTISTNLHVRRIYTSVAISLVMMTFELIAYRLGIFESVGLECDIRALSLSLVVFGGALAGWVPDQWTRPLIGWMTCIVLTFLAGSRMATVALLGVPILFPRLRSQWLRVALIVVSMLMGIGLFYTPTFQKRFFWTGHGTLTQVFRGEFLAFGRFEAWPKILTEAKLRPWLGHGVGSTRTFVPQVWQDISLPHNDYLRVGFETGIIGLVLYLTAATAQLISLWRIKNRGEGMVVIVSSSAILAGLLYMVCGLTDNPLTYAIWVTNPMFLLIGATYGLRQSKST
jgi:O-antigen ligase